jgi:hypothetical protein
VSAAAIRYLPLANLSIFVYDVLLVLGSIIMTDRGQANDDGPEDNS